MKKTEIDIDLIYDEVPDYLLNYGKSFITFRVSVYEGAPVKTLKITIKDVAKYYAFQANGMSGIRTIAGFSTDWRHVDGIAKEALEYFKQVNVETLRKEAMKLGIKPKF